MELLKQLFKGSKNSASEKVDPEKISPSESQVVAQANRLIENQVAAIKKSSAEHSSHSSEVVDELLEHRWSCGYILGVGDACMQKNNIRNDVGGHALLALVFVRVFGADQGAQHFGETIANQSDPKIMDGMMTGGKEVFNMSKEGEPNSSQPKGLVKFAREQFGIG